MRKIIRKRITRRPGRTIFSVILIIIGVMFLTGISISTSSLQYSEQLSYAEANMADFVVHTKGVPENITNSLTKLNNVKTVEGRLFIPTIFNYPPNYVGLEMWLFGVDVPTNVDRVKVMEGDFFFQKNDEALVLERSYFGAIIEGEHVGKKVEIVTPYGNRSLEVVGTFKCMWLPGYGGGMLPTGLIPIATAQEIFGFKGKVNALLVQVADKSRLDETIEEVRTELKDYEILSVIREGKVIFNKNFEPYMTVLLNCFRIVGILLVLVGAALVYNTLSLSVSDEARDIGALRASGFSNRQLSSVYVIRGLFLGLIGSVLGAFLGIWFSSFLLTGYTSFLTITETLLKVDWVVMLTYAGLGLFAVFLCTLPSAIKVYRMGSHMSVRREREAPSEGSPKVRTFKFVPVKYALRSLLRKKRRLVGMVALLAMSTVLNATGIVSIQTFKTNVDHYFENLEINSLIKINFAKPVEIWSTLDKISNIEGVRKAEPSLASLGWAKGFCVPVAGLRPNIELFKPQMIKGEWFADNGSVAVPTEFVATQMNLQVGDNITISTSVGGFHAVPNEITVKIVGIAQDMLLNMIYIPLNRAQELFGSSSMNLAVVQVEEGYATSDVAGQIRSSVPYAYPWPQSQFKQVFDSLATTPYVSLMSATIFFASSFSLIVIATIITLDVYERRKEFETLKAIGVTPRHIRNSVLIETLIIGLIGGGVGIILSTIFVLPLINTMSLIPFPKQPIVFPLTNYGILMALSLVIALLSSLIPAFSASKTRTAVQLSGKRRVVGR